MTQFKTVVESFQSDIKRLAEAMQLGFETMNAEFRYVKADIRELKDKTDRLEVKADAHTGQFARLQEDVTEIKNSLKLKVDREEFGKLEMRVTKLENKVA
jgi:hypothetical protein